MGKLEKNMIVKTFCQNVSTEKNIDVKISLVTTCKGRLLYLKESLKTWLKIDYTNFDIIIVDYDCPDGCEDYININKNNYIQDSKVSNIHVVKINNKPLFNLNDARNRGIDFADSELIFMIDADVHIKDNNILNYVSEQYNKGIVFFSNVAVLSTNFEEGHVFYKVKYGIERINYHSLLPTHCIDVGLSGTACFKKSIYLDCGMYNVKMNEQGWGSDDIEFYLRYLNYLFYNKFKDLNLTLLSTEAFSKASFNLVENTISEKTKFYQKKKKDSTIINRNYIIDLLTQTGEEYGWSKRDNELLVKPISIFKYKRYKKYVIPQWFQSWHNFRTGRFLYRTGDKVSCEKYFLNVIKDKSADEMLQMQSYMFIALIRKEKGRNGWKYYLNMAVKIFKNNKVNDVLLIFVERYNAASFLKHFGYCDEGKELFLGLIYNKNEVDDNLLTGTYYHLGELEYWNEDYEKSQDYFKKTLELNPDHRRANEYIKKISKK